jgi:Asp-tRNA(Asn)/Glu-tRNA(Gln) amidotransferase A subunit family amidase
MPDQDLWWLSATELAALMRKRKVSPVELVDCVLERIDKLNPRLNAYVLINADQARREAKAAERALGKRGAKLGRERPGHHAQRPDDVRHAALP